MSWRHKLKRNLKSLLLAYLLICVFMWGVQRHLMFIPFRDNADIGQYSLTEFSDVVLHADDGTAVHVWQHAARSGFPTIVFFHGNGGNLGNRALFLQAMANVGLGVMALDYRGYGKSEGSPSEEGFYNDARAVMRHALQDAHVPPERVILYGESIGTGVAVQMATEFKAAAVVLQSPYTSVEDRAKERYFWLPVHYLIQDRFDSLSKIGNVHAPLLLMHGELDTIVPVTDGKTLFFHANEPKQAVYFPDRGHNDLGVQQRVDALVAFLRERKLISLN